MVWASTESREVGWGQMWHDGKCRIQHFFLEFKAPQWVKVRISWSLLLKRVLYKNAWVVEIKPWIDFFFLFCVFFFFFCVCLIVVSCRSYIFSSYPGCSCLTSPALGVSPRVCVCVRNEGEGLRMKELCAPRSASISLKQLLTMSHRRRSLLPLMWSHIADLVHCHIYVSVQRIYSEPFVVRMRPGARPLPPSPPPPHLDAALSSSLCLCLLVLLSCVEAAVSEGGVYNGECDRLLVALGWLGWLGCLWSARSAWHCMRIRINCCLKMQT